MNYRAISVLGSTGSIGVQTLKVLEKFPEVKISALACGRDIDKLEAQIKRYNVPVAAVKDEGAARELSSRLSGSGVRVLQGRDGIIEAASLKECDVVLNAVTGMEGLWPTWAAIAAKKTVALANKEALVAGGDLVMPAAKAAGVSILPVDSEHSAIFQCLRAGSAAEVKRIILTASGGPFFGKSLEELKNVTAREALRHPNWSMGAKITVDSATMMNKGLEIIEAMHLFDLPPEKIEVVVHRESIIHSMVEFVDHSVIAQMGVPDMALPIQYALTHPKRAQGAAPPSLDLATAGGLSFFPPDEVAFPCLRLAKEAAKAGGTMPVVLNGANEAAVALFLEGKIGFVDIPRLVEGAMEGHSPRKISSLFEIEQWDGWSRTFVEEKAHVYAGS